MQQTEESEIILKPIETAPMDMDILLYWDKPNQFEPFFAQGSMTVFNGNVVHVLPGGDSVLSEPTHWAPIPRFL